MKHNCFLVRASDLTLSTAAKLKLSQYLSQLPKAIANLRQLLQGRPAAGARKKAEKEIANHLREYGNVDALFETPNETGPLYNEDLIKVLLDLSDHQYYDLTACPH